MESKLFSSRVPSSCIISHLHLAHLTSSSVTFSSSKRGQPFLFTVGFWLLTSSLSILILQPVAFHKLFFLCLKSFLKPHLKAMDTMLYNSTKYHLHHSLCERCPLELSGAHNRMTEWMNGVKAHFLCSLSGTQGVFNYGMWFRVWAQHFSELTIIFLSK